ncbi:hypothetical protein JCM10207_009048 [Rhodosporidiobolus poonsookiae]
MQGPRFPSHYTHGVPDLVPPPAHAAKPTPHRPSRPSSLARSASTWSAAPLPDLSPDPSASSATPDNPGDPPSKDEARREPSSSAGNRTANDLEAGKEGPPGSRKERYWAAVKRHAAFVGPGVIASVAYLDPGNWSTDLAAGSGYGYSHLFIILFAGLIALLFQILSTRLGCVSDYDLATQCRFALYDRPGRYKLVYRYALLWPLYIMAEIGIIFTDLAELLGSAIAINLLIPAVPLWAAVLLTSADVFLVLLLFNQYPARSVSTSMRVFELLIGILVLVVLGSFVALLVKVSPVWKDVFYGYVPRSGIVVGGGIYIAVGIVGATVMPHAFYIGSKMATMRRLRPSDYGEEDDPSRDLDDFELDDLKPKARGTVSQVDDVAAVAAPGTGDSPSRGRSRAARPRQPFLPSLHMPQPLSLRGAGVGFDLGSISRAKSRSRSRSPAPAPMPVRRKTSEMEIEEAPRPSPALRDEGDEAKLTPRDEADPLAVLPVTTTAPTTPVKPKNARAHPSRPKPSLACINAHLSHACFDIAGSLLGFAVVVNSCILILGAAVFYYGEGRTDAPDGISDLFDAYALVKEYLGQAFAYLFAVALLAAGQSASLTVTLSGQIVSEGFINWRTKPWKRRLVTRMIGIVPSLAVAIAVGREGIDTLLIASQVALSIVLTFVLLPLIIFTSQHSIMAVPLTPSKTPTSLPPRPSPLPSPALKDRLAAFARVANPLRRRSTPDGHRSFANPVWLVWICGMLWLLIGIANVYALYDVGAHGA